MGSTVLIPADLAGIFRPRPYQDLSWQDDALCAQVDSELWFPDKGGSVKEAKQICQACPVLSSCLEYALATDERFGVWGAMSERERRRLKRGVTPEPPKVTTQQHDDGRELVTTRQLAQRLGIRVDKNTAAKLRNSGHVPARTLTNGGYLWDPDTIPAGSVA